MNIKNFEFLRDGLKYLGFGDKMNADLENKIKQQPAEFKLSMVGEFSKGNAREKVDYRLDFKKSDQSDMYFLNRYHATLKNDDQSKERSQTFYITKNAGITAKEAYNLLSGRAVNKELTSKDNQPFNAWLQLDLKDEKDKNDNYKVKQYHQGYGYDLEITVAKFPIKEQLDEEQKAKLMRSLEKGNLTQVTFAGEGGEEKKYITANPQYKTLDVYDSNLQKQFQGAEKKEKNEPEKSNEKKETIRKGSDDDDPAKGKNRSKRKGVGV